MTSRRKMRGRVNGTLCETKRGQDFAKVKIGEAQIGEMCCMKIGDIGKVKIGEVAIREVEME